MFPDFRQGRAARSRGRDAARRGPCGDYVWQTHWIVVAAARKSADGIGRVLTNAATAHTYSAVLNSRAIKLMNG